MNNEKTMSTANRLPETRSVGRILESDSDKILKIMIKYKDSTLKVIGIDGISSLLININAHIIIFLIEKCKLKIIKNTIYLINTLILIFIMIEIYLFKSIIRTEFHLNSDDVLIISIISLVLFFWGYRWLPYWEDEP